MNLDVYLIRNAVKKGVGFFTSGGFYPDFIMWIIDQSTGKQHIVFIEPHGMYFEDLEYNYKIDFHKDIKKIEKKLLKDNSLIRLDSFIFSSTPYAGLNNPGRISKEDLQQQNVLFLEDGVKSITYMFKKITENEF